MDEATVLHPMQELIESMHFGMAESMLQTLQDLKLIEKTEDTEDAQ